MWIDICNIIILDPICLKIKIKNIVTTIQKKKLQCEIFTMTCMEVDESPETQQLLTKSFESE